MASLRTVSRRIFPVLLALSLLASTRPIPDFRAQAADNPIVAENQQAGSSGWQRSGLYTTDDANGQIKGYPSATSVSQNQTISFYISVNPPQAYTMDIYRMGWYGGLGGRLRLHVSPLDGSRQQPCVPDATTGMIACGWTPSYTMTIPQDWTSGVYVVQLTNATGYQNYMDFVVRDGRPAPFLYQQSVTTYEAYNNYPDDGVNGKSLYPYNSYGANTIGGDRRAVKVSFDRPYAWGGDGQFFIWEVQFVRWLERSGYDVTYSTDVDTHENGAELRNHKAILFPGHDEYWSLEMRDAVEGARDSGVSLGFFNANPVGRQMRFEPASDGVPDRVVVCYKSASIDPAAPGPTTTVDWRLPPLNRPEQTLVGVQWTAEVPWGSNVNYIVTNSSHWAYAGTGFRDGDAVPGIGGYEMDRYMANYAPPNAVSWTLLSDSPFTNSQGVADYANSSIYQAPSGAWVFAAGTTSWNWALDNYGQNLADPRTQQTTANILNAFLHGVPVVQDLKVTAPATVTAGQAFTFTVIAENAQGNPVSGYNGTVHFSTSDASSGIDLPPDSTLADGQGTFSATLQSPGSQTLTVADAANSFSTTINLAVQAGAANHFAVATDAQTATAGSSVSFTVTAQDQFGNTDSAYGGTVHFQTTDRSAGVVLPPDSTLVNGEGTFSATLDRAGAQTITVTDTADPSIAGAINVAVKAAPASHFAMAAAPTSTAGASFSFTVTAQDPFGNTDPTYGGTIGFQSSDQSPGVVLPPNSTLANGRGTFSATLDRAGSQRITGSDTANPTIGGTLTIRITPAAAASLSLGVPSAVKVNQVFTVSVTLADRFGNVATGYRGTVHFATSDAVAQALGKMPGDYRFTSADGGRHSFSVTLVTPPSQTITVTDNVDPSLSATSPPIAVNLL